MIKKENLIKCKGVENSYETEIFIDNLHIRIGIDPDDINIEETISLANKILKNFSKYKTKAEKIIVKEFLDNYNENWIDDGNPILSKEEFIKNLTLNGINFLSDESVDFFYYENGMFGNHSLIAQSFDGENFDDAMMYG